VKYRDQRGEVEQLFLEAEAIAVVVIVLAVSMTFYFNARSHNGNAQRIKHSASHHLSSQRNPSAAEGNE
jgi:hypothetical protein